MHFRQGNIPELFNKANIVILWIYEIKCDMTSFRIRPKFEIHMDQSVEEVTAGLKKALIDEDHPFDLVEIPGHLILKIKEADQHYWSPQLNMKFESDETQTIVRGRFQPHHNVWTLFVLCYLAIGVITLFIGIIGFSRMSLGMSSQILWSLPILAAVAFGLYFISQLGQKLGAEETYDLHHFAERTLRQSIKIV